MILAEHEQVKGDLGELTDEERVRLTALGVQFDNSGTPSRLERDIP